MPGACLLVPRGALGPRRARTRRAASATPESAGPRWRWRTDRWPQHGATQAICPCVAPTLPPPCPARRDTRIQKHLSRVYTTLCAAVLVLSVGCWAGMQFPLPPMLGGLASFGCTLALAMTPATPANLVSERLHAGTRALWGLLCTRLMS